MRLVKYFIDTDKLFSKGYKKIILYSSFIAGIVFIVCLFSLFHGYYFQLLFIYAGISLGVALGLIFCMFLLYTIAWNIYMLKKHPDLWKRTFLRTSVKERVIASQATRSLKDPYLNKIAILLNKTGLLILWIWLVVLMIIVIVVSLVKYTS